MPICASCGQDNPDIARFCLACGSPLAPAASAGTREERKVVSVLFADLVGFTSRAERLDPEDVRKLLAPYWEHVRGELERHGGTVEKFIGDAVVAVFGAPVAHEDDPERAVRAALAIREWIAAQEGDLQLRIAVTTGEALVRLDARPLEGEGVASGDVVNTAARLQAAAPENGVLVDETTFRATTHSIDYRVAQPVVAKGKSQPILVWEAVQARSRFGADVPAAYRTPLVAREREVDELRDAFARARHDAAPQLVTLVGVPGIGKSRLVYELSRIVDADPELVRWRQGRSLPYGEAGSYWALGEMVKAEAGILESDGAEASAAKLRASVEEALEEEHDRDATLVRLQRLVGLAADDDLVGGDRRPELFAAWRRYLEGLAEHRPTVLVFEDLHWADDDLLDFVDHLADWATGVPLLVVGTARPELLERRPGWGGGKRNAATISLAPLDEQATSRLVASLVGSGGAGIDELVARAGGNPLFAEQYARMLDERREGAGGTVPETVQGIIAARLDGLAPQEKALLQDASVLGKVFWAGALDAIGDERHADVEELLHQLERKEFVQRARRSSVAGDTELSFRHALVRDVAYNQIPRVARAEKHRRAAAWIAALGRPDDHADLLAHHYLTALELARAAGVATPEDVDAARAALVDAGDRATALYAFGPAGRFYADALELTADDDADLPLLLYRLARVEHERGNPEVIGVLVRTREALLAAGDTERAAETVTRLAQAVWMRGDRDAALEHLDRGSALVRDLPPSEPKAYVLANQARFHMLAGRSEAAIAAADQALAMAAELGLDYIRIHTLNSLGPAYVYSGDPETGLRLMREALELAERLQAQEIVRCHVNLGSVLNSLGKCEEARRVHERGRVYAAERSGAFGTVWIDAELAHHSQLAGEWSDALATADAVLETVRTTPHLMEMLARGVRGSIYAARGDLDAAVHELERMAAIARGSKDPQAIYPALAFYAETLLAAGRREEAGLMCDELFAVASDEPVYALEDWATALALTLRALGRLDELPALLAEAPPLGSPWRDAAEAVVAGDLVAAAEALRRAGDLARAATTRLVAAEDLLAEGRRREAEEQVRLAVEFHAAVGATAHLARAEALLAATSSS